MNRCSFLRLLGTTALSAAVPISIPVAGVKYGDVYIWGKDNPNASLWQVSWSEDVRRDLMARAWVRL